jgi:hypothetical protein
MVLCCFKSIAKGGPKTGGKAPSVGKTVSTDGLYGQKSVHSQQLTVIGIQIRGKTAVYSRQSAEKQLPFAESHFTISF